MLHAAVLTTNVHQERTRLMPRPYAAVGLIFVSLFSPVEPWLSSPAESGRPINSALRLRRGLLPIQTIRLHEYVKKGYSART
jgi:hypothetical protein